mmetsp:Transcript_29560/g.74304  ORF Transcript_29560/g.74304 Transcript_29560/m.74304 type:complete len:224 (-) Transcript_29560:430-1101(-)
MRTLRGHQLKPPSVIQAQPHTDRPHSARLRAIGPGPPSSSHAWGLRTPPRRRAAPSPVVPPSRRNAPPPAVPSILGCTAPPPALPSPIPSLAARPARCYRPRARLRRHSERAAEAALRRVLRLAAHPRRGPERSCSLRGSLPIRTGAFSAASCRRTLPRELATTATRGWRASSPACAASRRKSAPARSGRRAAPRARGRSWSSTGTERRLASGRRRLRRGRGA